MKENNSFYVKIVSGLIVVSPILNIYSLGIIPLGIGDTMILFLACISFVRMVILEKKIPKPNNMFTVVFLCYFMVTLCILLFQDNMDFVDFFSKWGRIFPFMWTIDFISKEDFDYEYARRICVNVTTVIAVLLISQILCDYFWGIHLYPYTSFLPLNYGKSLSEMVVIFNRAVNWGGWRPSAIFIEPAHFCQFELIGLVFLLFGSEGEKKNQLWVQRIVISLAIFFTNSANGVILAIIIWGIWLVLYFKKRISPIKLILLILVIVFGSAFLFQSTVVQGALQRVATTNVELGQTTGNQRILQGIYVYEQLPFFNKLFGTGFGNLQYVLTQEQIVTPFLEELGNEYMNSFSTVLVSSGIIGLIFYCIVWGRMFIKEKSVEQKMVWVTITILSCTSCIFYSCISVLYLVFAATSYKNREYNLSISKQTNA